MGLAAGILGAGSLVSAGAGLIGSSEAASAQTSAANQANATQQGEFNTVQNNLEPYNAAGQNATNLLTGQLSSLTAPINMNESTLEQTPGYQFNLTQGLKATQSAAAARGLGVSGAALKGAASYATGLADSTYQNQFNNAQTNRTFALNALTGQQSLGENAAAGVGNAAVSTGQGIAQTDVGTGAAQGAADLAGASAVGNAGSSLASGYLFNNLANQGGLFSGSGSTLSGDLPYSLQVG